MISINPHLFTVAPYNTSDRYGHEVSDCFLSTPFAPKKTKRILVPVDFSTHSEAVVGYALKWAEQLGAKLILVSAVEPLAYALTMSSMADNQPVETNEKCLRTFAEKMVKPDLLETIVVRLGSAAEVITSIAWEYAVDLVILHTKHHHALRDLFRRNAVERIVREAPCSVFVMRIPERVALCS